MCLYIQHFHDPRRFYGTRGSKLYSDGGAHLRIPGVRSFRQSSIRRHCFEVSHFLLQAHVKISFCDIMCTRLLSCKNTVLNIEDGIKLTNHKGAGFILPLFIGELEEHSFSGPWGSCCPLPVSRVNLPSSPERGGHPNKMIPD